jgi:TetR/AcrR family transcriptional repressor of lmrAB and yxaGH operons
MAAATTQGSDTRARILHAAVKLLRRQGYAATGIKQVVEEGGAPLGSVYHYFPGGKEQLCVEALELSGEKIRATIERAGDAADLPAAIHAYFAVNAERLRDSDYEAGCPIATVSLEIASLNEAIRAVCEQVFTRWQVTLAGVLGRAGIPDDAAARLAVFVLSTYEGALTISRTLRDVTPLLTSGEAVASVLRSRLADIAPASVSV